MRDLRFGFTLATHDSANELAQTCRTAEAYGYDIATAVDHLGPGRAAPFQAALAAAFVNQTLRVGTFVINNGLWNPTVLAREVTTAVRMTGDRFEFGLGAGTIKAQFDAAGIPWHDFTGRMDRMERAIEEVYELLAREEDLTPPPLLVGGTSRRSLRIAARLADTVSFGGRFQVPGQPFGTLTVIDADTAMERMEFFRSAAGDRLDDIELNVFVIDVELTDDREAAARRFVEEDPGPLTVEQALETPFLLYGTEEEIANQILASRERYGFTSFFVQRPHMTALGPAIKHARSLT